MFQQPRRVPYPELKRGHTAARTGRPYHDYVPPTSAPVWDIIEGFGRFHTLTAALDLGVFEALADAPMTTAELAAALGLDAGRLATIVDAVVSLGFLDRLDGGAVELNDTSRRYLLRDSPASMADLVAVSPGPHENWTRLADTVRTGRPPAPVDNDAGFYAPLVEATFATINRCAQRADHQLRYTALDRPRVLELGAGGAPWSAAILGANPDATAVVNDLADVLPIARHHLDEAGVADRCECRPGDYLDVDIEPDRYDLVVLGHLLRAEGVDRARRLVRRAAEALKPGGRVLVGDYFADRSRSERPQALMMGVTMLACTTAGAAYTAERVGAWMADAGLDRMRLIEPIGFQSVLVATKPNPKERSR